MRRVLAYAGAWALGVVFIAVPFTVVGILVGAPRLVAPCAAGLVIGLLLDRVARCLGAA